MLWTTIFFCATLEVEVTMEIEEYLKSLGMNDEEIETVKRKYNKVNTKHAEENVNKLKNLFSIENEEIWYTIQRKERLK